VESYQAFVQAVPTNYLRRCCHCSLFYLETPLGCVFTEVPSALSNAQVSGVSTAGGGVLTTIVVSVFCVAAASACFLQEVMAKRIITHKTDVAFFMRIGDWN
jgi:hypothetical protein